MDFSAQPSIELWNHAQTLVENVMAYVGTLLFATMGNAAGSEAVLRWIYNRWVRKEGMPPAETLVMGWDNLAVQGEKSLFDLAGWMKERVELRKAFATTETGAVVQAMQAQLPLPGVPEGDWAVFRERFEQHLQRFGHIVFQLDFAADLPADHPEPMIEVLEDVPAGRRREPL